MRWLATLLFVALSISTVASAQDDEPALGISTGAGSAGGEPDTSAGATDASTGDGEPAGDAEPTGSDADAGDDASSDVQEETDAAHAEPEETSEPGPVPVPPHWNDERTAAWVTFAASFGVAVVGGVLLAVGLDDVSSIENAPDGIAWSSVAGALDRAPLLTGIGGVVLGLGIAGTAVGAVLLAVYGQGGTWVEVSALPGGIAARGRF